MMNVQLLEKCFRNYPRLEGFIDAGNISLKMARSILCIDRTEMYYLFLDLLEARAVKSTGNANTFKATPELLEYMAQKRSVAEE